jgi:hypothetical protein
MDAKSFDDALSMAVSIVFMCDGAYMTKVNNDRQDPELQRH